MIYNYDPAGAATPGPMHVRNVYDALPEHTLREGDVVTVDLRDRRAVDGYHVGKLHGVEGLVPTAFIEPVVGATEFNDGGRVRAAVLQDSRLYNSPHIGSMHMQAAHSSYSMHSNKNIGGVITRLGQHVGGISGNGGGSMRAGRRGTSQFWLRRARFSHNASHSAARLGTMASTIRGDRPLLSFERGDIFTSTRDPPRSDGLVAVWNTEKQAGLVPANFLETVKC